MITSKPLSLNLASYPLRNRRLFYLLFSVLGIALLLVLFLAGRTFFEYRYKAQKMRASIWKTEQLIIDVQREEKEFQDRIEDAIRAYKKKVDLINSIILSKSFSWIEFLSDLENSLPDSSYIVSLAPTLTKDLKLQLRFKVASQNINDLLKLINNLRALKFDQIRITSEAESERGTLLSEISLIYERNI